MKKLAAWLTVLCVVLGVSVALAGEEEIRYAVVNNPDPADRLNLRLAPTRDALSIGKYFNGAVVQVLEEVDDAWTLVRVGDVAGYMMTKYLLVYDGSNNWTAIEPAMPQAVLQNPYATMQQLLDSTGAAMRLLLPIPNGAAITVLGIADAYAHIQYGGVTGYVPLNCVDMQQYEAAGESNVEVIPGGDWVEAAPGANQGQTPEGLTFPKGGIVQAKLIWGDGSRVLRNTEDLWALVELLQSYEYRGEMMAGCPFEATLTLDFPDGSSKVVEIATDSCCIYRYNGYDFAYGRDQWNADDGLDNDVLFSLFEE